MIGFALKHTCLVRRYSGSDYVGTPSYLDPLVFKCFKQEGFIKVLALNGEEAVSRCVYYTVAEIGEDDIVDDYPVLRKDTFSMLGIKYYRTYT